MWYVKYAPISKLHLIQSVLNGSLYGKKSIILIKKFFSPSMNCCIIIIFMYFLGPSFGFFCGVLLCWWIFQDGLCAFNCWKHWTLTSGNNIDRNYNKYFVTWPKICWSNIFSCQGCPEKNIIAWEWKNVYVRFVGNYFDIEMGKIMI